MIRKKRGRFRACRGRLKLGDRLVGGEPSPPIMTSLSDVAGRLAWDKQRESTDTGRCACRRRAEGGDRAGLPRCDDLNLAGVDERGRNRSRPPLPSQPGQPPTSI